MYYSVPYEYIKHEVEIRTTQTVIEIFYQTFRIASHVGLFGKEGQLSTVPEHMPEDHQNYTNWNRDYYTEWAKTVGKSTTTTVEGLFSIYKTEKQALKACMALIKLSNSYSLSRIETACEKALTYSPRPNLQSIKTILHTGQDQINIKENSELQHENQYGYTRGAAYYGRKN
ncbi:hypothetical protein LIT27_26705 [Cytobacillus oceanisediminis]|nr:hypothetical protein [Cytobacillus oceanisediminis]USK44112.1 hypothetical protein LIT27_26705 [Cytobacillus oceanisediminis]